MKKSLCFLMVLLAVSFVSVALAQDVRVHGYTRSDGTYVQPHYRTQPDGNKFNNYSYPGNLNPHTGQIGGHSTPNSFPSLNNQGLRENPLGNYGLGTSDPFKSPLR